MGRTEGGKEGGGRSGEEGKGIDLVEGGRDETRSTQRRIDKIKGEVVHSYVRFKTSVLSLADRPIKSQIQTSYDLVRARPAETETRGRRRGAQRDPLSTTSTAAPPLDPQARKDVVFETTIVICILSTRARCGPSSRQAPLPSARNWPPLIVSCQLAHPLEHTILLRIVGVSFSVGEQGRARLQLQEGMRRVRKDGSANARWNLEQGREGLGVLVY